MDNNGEFDARCEVIALDMWQIGGVTMPIEQIRDGIRLIAQHPNHTQIRDLFINHGVPAGDIDQAVAALKGG